MSAQLTPERVASRASRLKRNLSRNEVDGIKDGVKEALDAVSKQKQQLEEEGLSQVSFFCGLCNVVVTTYVFAKYPWHLWLLYAAKCVLLIPAWWVSVIKVYNGALFILDFCWIANILFGLYMCTSFFDLVPPTWRYSAFLVFYSSALGPLGWACVLLSNGMIFHSVEKATSLFIHFTPLVVAWTVMHYHEKLAEVWPNRFPGPSELQATTFWSVYTHGLAFYVTWWVLHSCWLLSVGVKCPQWGYDTVFDNLYKKHSLDKLFTKMTSLTSIRSHALIYLLLHFVAVNVGLCWAAACFHFEILHVMFGLFVCLAAAWNGAGYYDYIIAKKYTKVLQKLLSDKES
eukprot:TRINITY_DN91402_c0_g1_i1.p1 TRINITY_DN91402_c0_g1~~TRINITY_DN91402_c0_g1_i1.p1  ORF type:complete len:344 (-),score=47.66 TRINITY_DN91402_c0_g1_i1:223-1254(-)